jgi:pyrroline-5-carboxylate reductase
MDRLTEREIKAKAYHLADLIETKAQALIKQGMTPETAIHIVISRMSGSAQN